MNFGELINLESAVLFLLALCVIAYVFFIMKKLTFKLYALTRKAVNTQRQTNRDIAKMAHQLKRVEADNKTILKSVAIARENIIKNQRMI